MTETQKSFPDAFKFAFGFGNVYVSMRYGEELPKEDFFVGLNGTCSVEVKDNNVFSDKCHKILLGFLLQALRKRNVSFKLKVVKILSFFNKSFHIHDRYQPPFTTILIKIRKLSISV